MEMNKQDFINAISDVISQSFESFKEELETKMDQRLQPIQKQLNSIEDRLGKIEDRLEEVEDRLTKVELMLENETGHGIKIIAEGHMDLAQKLDEVIYTMNEIKERQEIHEMYIKKHERILTNIS